jgi:hypothetical protein
MCRRNPFTIDISMKRGDFVDLASAEGVTALGTVLLHRESTVDRT